MAGGTSYKRNRRFWLIADEPFLPFGREDFLLPPFLLTFLPRPLPRRRRSRSLRCFFSTPQEVSAGLARYTPRYIITLFAFVGIRNTARRLHDHLFLVFGSLLNPLTPRLPSDFLDRQRCLTHSVSGRERVTCSGGTSGVSDEVHLSKRRRREIGRGNLDHHADWCFLYPTSLDRLYIHTISILLTTFASSAGSATFCWITHQNRWLLDIGTFDVM